MICSSCHNENADIARFCNKCGAVLMMSEIPASPASTSGSGGAIAPPVDNKQAALLGQTIEGRYRIDSLIGLGGMGSVYRATRLLIGDEVAIKILHTERVADPHAAERFRREAQAAARLKHPNAVSIYDFGVSGDGLQYLVMELVEGESLRQIIKQQGPLPASVPSEIITQVCGALDEAHRQHIVHRDIKPDNIIIHATIAGLRVKVLDFGIAKLRDDVASHLTQTGSVMGTPHYMSPEQCLGEELDGRADVYSLGIVLYEMLCGRVPFNSPISTAVVVQHVNQPPAPPRSINVGISPMVEAVVLHALEKRREARPQTAGALAQELASAAGAQSSSGYLTPPQTPVSVQPQNRDVEETVMQSAVRTPSANEMPATVHLPAAQASGSTPSIRSTVPSGMHGVPKPNLRLILVIGGSVFGFILLAVVGAVITWSLVRSGKSGETTLPGRKDEKVQINPTPPAGMAYVPGGEFTMGSNAGDPLEQPAHKVTVQSFFVDIYEVSREDYEKFVNATGHGAPTGWASGHYPSGTAKWPATGVSWDDANAYAKWAGKRLPTEAEWEFAARGSEGLKYPWGNSWKPGCANADEEGKALKGMAKVGSHAFGSPFGAFDMVGNAWEWTATDLTPYPGGQFPDRLPDGLAVKRGKVIRGGCYLSKADQATTTFRRGWPPRGENYDNSGFRCVENIDASHPH